MSWRVPVGGGKRDAAEPDIIKALRQIGAEVTQLSGKGCPDLLVWFRDHWQPLEVKTGKGKTTRNQQAIRWPLVRTPEDALKAIGASR